MGAVNWNAEITIVDSGGTKHAVTREDFTVSATADIANIDTTYLLQGSIVYDISTGKLHIFDGSAWVEKQ